EHSGSEPAGGDFLQSGAGTREYNPGFSTEGWISDRSVQLTHDRPDATSDPRPRSKRTDGVRRTDELRAAVPNQPKPFAGRELRRQFCAENEPAARRKPRDLYWQFRQQREADRHLPVC